MNVGTILANVKKLCQDKQYEEAQLLIDKNKELLGEKYDIAQRFIDIKKGSLMTRLKSFIG